MTNATRTLLLLAALSLASACAPRIQVRYDVPATVHFGGAVQHVYVAHNVGDPTVLTVLDPLAALVRTVVAPDVARHLEAKLIEAQLFTVSPDCLEPCPAADARVEVELDSSSVSRGRMKTQQDDGEATTAAAGVIVRVLNRDGTSRFQQTYHGTASAGVPRPDVVQPTDDTLIRSAAYDAVDGFVRDLRPSTGTATFVVSDEGSLQPGVRLALDGDLDGAWNALRDLVQREPDNAAAWYHLGVVMTAKGELEHAREAFAQAARLDPQYAEDLRDADARLGLRDSFRAQQGP